MVYTKGTATEAATRIPVTEFLFMKFITFHSKSKLTHILMISRINLIIF